MNLFYRRSARLLCASLLLLFAYMVINTDNITLKQDKINSAISNTTNRRREIKCEAHDDINEYLKCRRRLLLRYCGEVCDTTPEVDERKYYCTVIKSYVFRII